VAARKQGKSSMQELQESKDKVAIITGGGYGIGK
jgi:hypothetical protein